MTARADGDSSEILRARQPEAGRHRQQQIEIPPAAIHSGFIVPLS
jgi:hypothetical protein